jgi:chlorobactene glucosyltransferase
MFCIYFLFLTINNILFLKRVSNFTRCKRYSKVSIILPARDEELHIRSCLDSLINQDYPDFEILVINDGSKDHTGKIIQEYAKKCDKIKAFDSLTLPKGWNGKQFACQQLVEKANGEYLIFTDADVLFMPNCLSWLIGKIQDLNVDFISGYPKQNIGSMGELLIVPGMFIMTSIILPLQLVYKSKNPDFSFAIGQIIAVRSEAFRAINEYHNIKNTITDDMALAKEMKQNGYKTIFLDAQKYVSCRMYNNFKEAMAGYIRVIFTALNRNLLYVSFLVAALLGIIEIPCYFLLNYWMTHGICLCPNLLPPVLFLSSWSISLYDRKMPLYSPLLYPFLFLNIIIFIIISTIKTGFGKGVLWKGRLVK